MTTTQFTAEIQTFRVLKTLFLISLKWVRLSNLPVLPTFSPADGVLGGVRYNSTSEQKSLITEHFFG